MYEKKQKKQTTTTNISVENLKAALSKFQKLEYNSQQ
jgi:hypothetical protein